MEDRMDSGQADKLEELIRAEKEAAERSFETTSFDDRLFERIRGATAARPTMWLVLLRKPGPAVALAALVLAIAGFLLFRKPSPSPFPQTVRAMSAVLGDAGEGRQMKEGDSTAQRIATAEYTELGWALKRVLYACRRESLGDVELKHALSRVFIEEGPRTFSPRNSVSPALPGAGSLQLKSDEDFQTFFSSFLKRFKEV